MTVHIYCPLRHLCNKPCAVRALAKQELFLLVCNIIITHCIVLYDCKFDFES